MIQRNRSENWKTDWKLPKLNRKKKKKDLKLEDSLRDLLNNIKCTSFPLLGSQKEKREKRGQRTRLKK